MLRGMIKDIAKIWKSFCSYVDKIKYIAFVLIGYTFLVHFSSFSSVVPGIDTEVMINNPAGVYQMWLGIGREGLYWAKKLLGSLTFNPWFAAMMALLFLAVACLFAPFIVTEACGEKELPPKGKWFILLFGMVVVSHPIIAEQYYFTLQSEEIGFCFLLLELALFTSHLWSSEKNILWLLAAVALQIIPFSAYQSMIPLFIAGAAIITFLRSIEEELSFRKQLPYLLRYILAFVVGFGVTETISMIRYFDQGTYLTEQIYWGKNSVSECVSVILQHIRNVLLGRDTAYFAVYGISCAGLLLITCVFCTQKIKREEIKISTAVWQIILLFSVFASPFYMTILMANVPVFRAQLVLPFMSGAVLMLSICIIDKWGEGIQRKLLKSIAQAAVVLLCLFTVYREASVTEAIYYTDTLAKESDLYLAFSLQEAIDEFTGQSGYSGSIIFLGRKEALSNSAVYRVNMLGVSVFAWDTDGDPQYYYSTARIVGFLNSLGASYSACYPEYVIQATEEMMDTMTCYPLEGSIAWMGDIVVVKLSDE